MPGSLPATTDTHCIDESSRRRVLFDTRQNVLSTCQVPLQLLTAVHTVMDTPYHLIKSFQLPFNQSKLLAI